MNTYRIHTPHFIGAIITSDDLVLQAAPLLSWTVGNSFTYVRDVCNARGWQVEPLETAPHPSWIEYDGHVYELHWHNEALTRISLHENGEIHDLTYNELPDELKGLL